MRRLRSFPELPPYEVPEQDRDLLNCGVSFALDPDVVQRTVLDLPSKIIRSPYGIVPRSLTPNDIAILHHVFEHGPVSRSDLSAATGITKLTIARILGDLQHADLVRILPKCVGRGGNYMYVFVPSNERIVSKIMNT
jgi:predicted transcriptional regulator